MKNYKGYYKVSEKGLSVTTACFYNPENKKEFRKIVWDIEDDRLIEDEEIQILRNLEIDPEIKKTWLHDHGIISKGDLVKIVKGRKIPIGTISVVTDIYDWCDKYGRAQTKYVVLYDGRKTNIKNCELVK